MNNYMSISTISSPEFINLKPLDVSPFISKCDIKVLYLGKNRNNTSIDKETAMEMAKTLRGNPIVGYYRKEDEDFQDHGKKITIDGKGVHFDCLTQPYGFVAPDADVWFQDFEVQKDDGTSIVKTFLMTTGYLWTGQYEEAQQILDDGGKGQSMELDDETMQGHWANDFNSNREFFIISDAMFTKLCVLGDDVEPCFEGASVTAPEVSTNFTLDKNFATTLYTMMKELKETLQGGIDKVEEQNKEVLENEVQETAEAQTEELVAEDPAVETPVVEETAAEDAGIVEEAPAADFEQNEDNSVESIASENEVNIEEPSVEFEKKEDDEKEESKDDSEDEENTEDEDKKKKEEDYALLKTDYDNLKAEYETLKEEVESLREYKLDKENEAKDALISEFYMLSDEDKKDVIDNKTSYTLDEIKSKLAVICYDKKINYSNSKDSDDKLADATVNMAQVDSSTPEWLQAVDAHSNR